MEGKQGQSSQGAESGGEQKPHATRWLSRDYAQLARHIRSGGELFDVVIVGTGYGGAMAAAELAGLRDASGTELSVCVLERGSEYLPGSFPSTAAELFGHVRVSTEDHPEPRGRREGLFDLRVGSEVSALVGNGLGGGSLINGAVMEVPAFGTFHSHMPAGVEADLNALYGEVKVMLGSAAPAGNGGANDNTIALHPDVTARPLPKREALDRFAAAAGTTCRDAAITIEMLGGPNAQGVTMERCTLCGDCMTGCNVGARRSLDTNLLVRAKQRGAHLYTGASVLQVRRNGDEWELEVTSTDKRLRETQGPQPLLRARKLILAAGTLGSTEILLRSRKEEKLDFSPLLGARFSCNGDNLAAVHDQQAVVDSVARETQPLREGGKPARHVGPTITGVVDMDGGILGQRFLVQEFAVPAPLARLFSELVTTGRSLQDLGRGDFSVHRPSSTTDPLRIDPKAMARTSLLGLIGHDDAGGTLSLPKGYTASVASSAVQSAYEGGLRIRWEQAASNPAVERAFAAFEKAAKTLGRVIPNPAWRPLPANVQAVLGAGGLPGGLLTVHPLGGCSMGTSWRDGVVDSHGMVFDFAGDRTKSWEGSLLVLDGSIVPGSLGANPALTIAALSLRAVRHWRKVWEWTDRPNIEARRGPGPRPVYRRPEDCVKTQVAPTELQIVERLAGRVRLRRGLQRETFVAELTLGFKPVVLEALSGGLPALLQLVKDGQDADLRQLRLYPSDVWDKEHLGAKDDGERQPFAVVTAELGGSLRLLHREFSFGWLRVLRGGAAYLWNRGLRDIWQQWLKPAVPGGPTSWQRIVMGIRLASLAGEVRRFDYDLEVLRVQTAAGTPALVRPGDRIHGAKRFTYSCESNPWNQLLYLDLHRFPGLPKLALWKPAALKLDAAFLARRGIPLARLTGQQDQPSALAELASFGLYWARLMMSVHAWSFRAPDAAPRRTAQRLPGALPGLPAPEVQEIEMVSWTGTSRVRLTRYRHQGNQHPPLVMIHGYSASGTTFAHPDLDMSMAQYCWDRGRDIWILDLRTSAGMPTATLPWSFEKVAHADIPLAVERIVRQVARERGKPEADIKVDVFAHCIGAVMLSMALLTWPQAKPGKQLSAEKQALRRLPSRIHRIVLSQKGFALSYTDANLLRAYVMRFLQPLILPDGYKFRASPISPSAGDQLLDRFLAALPYPPHEFRRENPLRPWVRTPWVATRHRMDALYERTFSVNNLSDKVLEKIDDFFGPLNVQTVTQTVHFARYRCATNQAGRNDFVTARALRRWPRGGTLSLHAPDNGMVAPYTLVLMEQAMGRAGIPFSKELLTEGAGHQDCLIGKDAVATFEKVERFLQGPRPVCATHAEHRAWEVPWLGPRLHRSPTLDGTVRLPDEGPQAIGANMAHLLIAGSPAQAEALAVVLPVQTGATGFTLVHSGQASFPMERVGAHSGWRALLLPAAPAGCTGFVVLVRGDFPGRPNGSANAPGGALARLSAADAAQALQSAGQDVARAYISLEAVRRMEACDPHGLRLVVSSCQYPAGILDAMPARRSLDALQAHVKTDRPDAVLMVGDQIYADATAGLLDPTRADDRYGRSYEDWLALAPLRQVMRSVPVHMTLDDHEIVDNWEPVAGSPAAAASVETARRTARKAKEQALDEFWRYQRGAVPANYADSPWHQVTVGSFEVFMADTRSQRNRQLQTLLDSTQAFALDSWLIAQSQREQLEPHPRPKFVACGSWIAPRRAGAPGEPEPSERCDGWEGFTTSQAEVLAGIASGGHRGVVLLAGDAHLGCWAELTLRQADGQGEPVRVLCIHAPAMYAPFPFANARREDFIENEVFSLPGTPYVCEVRATFPGEGEGFVALEAQGVPGSPWQLRATMLPAGAKAGWMIC